VAIYLLSLAEMTGIDLQDQIEAKMAKNAARVYQRLPNDVIDC
jgi:NTP pyrophosphatase (non-canonical NTP hydrolase)